MIDSWGYVSNPSGGFLGACRHFADFPRGQMFLQFEERKLCFKIYGRGGEQRSSIRNKSHETLLETSGGRFPIDKPSRFGVGEYMTIAVADDKDVWVHRAD